MSEMEILRVNVLVSIVCILRNVPLLFTWCTVSSFYDLACCSVVTCVLLLATRNMLGTIFTEDQYVHVHVHVHVLV